MIFNDTIDWLYLIDTKRTIYLFFIIITIIFYFTLQYCIGFAIHQHEFTTAVHMFPILKPPPYLPPHTIPLGHPSAPATSILYPASNLDW